MTPPESTSTDALVHRALASPVRTRLLEYLRAEPDLDAATLALRLGMHVNTVRSHIAVLAEANLVRAEAERQDRPGRPRLRYRATRTVEADRSSDQRAYQFLAGILTSYLAATVPDSTAAAEEAGHAWGAYIMDKPAPFTRVDAADAIARLTSIMDEFGFKPQVDDAAPDAPRILLHRCPFLEIAREHQAIVCSVHLGLIRGALEQLDAPIRAESLTPWATPEVCITHLRATA